jgi:hypothetical protein
LRNATEGAASSALGVISFGQAEELGGGALGGFEELDGGGEGSGGVDDFGE